MSSKRNSSGMHALKDLIKEGNRAVNHCRAGGAFLSKVNFPEISSYDKDMGRKAFETSKQSFSNLIMTMPPEHAKLLLAGIEPTYYMKKEGGGSKFSGRLSSSNQGVRPNSSLGFGDTQQDLSSSRKRTMRMSMKKLREHEDEDTSRVSNFSRKDRRYSVLSSLSFSLPPSSPMGAAKRKEESDVRKGERTSKGTRERSVSASALRRAASAVTELEKVKIGLDDSLKQKLGRFKRDRINTYRRKFNALCGNTASAIDMDALTMRPTTAPVRNRASMGESFVDTLQPRPVTRETLYNSSTNNVSQELAKARCWADIEATQEAILRIEDQTWCGILMEKLSKSSNRSTGLLHGERVILEEVTKTLVEGSHFGQMELQNVFKQFSEDDFLSKDVEELVSILVRATNMTMAGLEKCYTEILGAVTAHEALNCLDAHQKQNMTGKRFTRTRRYNQSASNLYITKYREIISKDAHVQHLLKRMNK